MNLRKLIIQSTALVLIIPLFLMFLADSECAQAKQKNSDELLLEIMDLHSELVSNEIFLAQAKMLGAYLEAAQQLGEVEKNKIYTKVLNILAKIKSSAKQAQSRNVAPVNDSEEKSLREVKQERKTVYEPGAALLEIFKTDSIDTLPDLPVIRTYWERDLGYSGGFLLPERFLEIGKNSHYIARFSFYYEAKESGKYGFTVIHNPNNQNVRLIFPSYLSKCKLVVGNVKVVEVTAQELVAQDVCNLRKGFHRVEFYLVSFISSTYNPEQDTGIPNATFQVKVLTPNSFDAVPLTKDMMLLKKE